VARGMGSAAALDAAMAGIRTRRCATASESGEPRGPTGAPPHGERGRERDGGASKGRRAWTVEGFSMGRAAAQEIEEKGTQNCVPPPKPARRSSRGGGVNKEMSLGL
jgi:hypothetical protein